MSYYKHVVELKFCAKCKQNLKTYFAYLMLNGLENISIYTGNSHLSPNLGSENQRRYEICGAKREREENFSEKSLSTILFRNNVI